MRKSFSALVADNNARFRQADQSHPEDIVKVMCALF